MRHVDIRIMFDRDIDRPLEAAAIFAEHLRLLVANGHDDSGSPWGYGAARAVDVSPAPSTPDV